MAAHVVADVVAEDFSPAGDVFSPAEQEDAFFRDGSHRGSARTLESSNWTGGSSATGSATASARDGGVQTIPEEPEKFSNDLEGRKRMAEALAKQRHDSRPASSAGPAPTSSHPGTVGGFASNDPVMSSTTPQGTSVRPGSSSGGLTSEVARATTTAAIEGVLGPGTMSAPPTGRETVASADKSTGTEELREDLDGNTQDAADVLDDRKPHTLIIGYWGRKQEFLGKNTMWETVQQYTERGCRMHRPSDYQTDRERFYKRNVQTQTRFRGGVFEGVKNDPKHCKFLLFRTFSKPRPTYDVEFEEKEESWGPEDHARIDGQTPRAPATPKEESWGSEDHARGVEYTDAREGFVPVISSDEETIKPHVAEFAKVRASMNDGGGPAKESSKLWDPQGRRV